MINRYDQYIPINWDVPMYVPNFEAALQTAGQFDKLLTAKEKYKQDAEAGMSKMESLVKYIPDDSLGDPGLYRDLVEKNQERQNRISELYKKDYTLGEEELRKALLETEKDFKSGKAAYLNTRYNMYEKYLEGLKPLKEKNPEVYDLYVNGPLKNQLLKAIDTQTQNLNITEPSVGTYYDQSKRDEMLNTALKTLHPDEIQGLFKSADMAAAARKANIDPEQFARNIKLGGFDYIRQTGTTTFIDPEKLQALILSHYSTPEMQSTYNYLGLMSGKENQGKMTKDLMTNPQTLMEQDMLGRYLTNQYSDIDIHEVHLQDSLALQNYKHAQEQQDKYNYFQFVPGGVSGNQVDRIDQEVINSRQIINNLKPQFDALVASGKVDKNGLVISQLTPQESELLQKYNTAAKTVQDLSPQLEEIRSNQMSVLGLNNMGTLSRSIRSLVGQDVPSKDVGNISSKYKQALSQGYSFDEFVATLTPSEKSYFEKQKYDNPYSTVAGTGTGVVLGPVGAVVAANVLPQQTGLDKLRDNFNTTKKQIAGKVKENAHNVRAFNVNGVTSNDAQNPLYDFVQQNSGSNFHAGNYLIVSPDGSHKTLSEYVKENNLGNPEDYDFTAIPAVEQFYVDGVLHPGFIIQAKSKKDPSRSISIQAADNSAMANVNYLNTARMLLNSTDPSAQDAGRRMYQQAAFGEDLDDVQEQLSKTKLNEYSMPDKGIVLRRGTNNDLYAYDSQGNVLSRQGETQTPIRNVTDLQDLFTDLPQQ